MNPVRDSVAKGLDALFKTGISNGMNKISIYTIGIVLFIGAVVWFAAASDGDEASSKYSLSALTAVENSFSAEGGPASGWDFGMISMEDGDVTHNFKLRNEGEESVTIEKVYTSCMCTTAFILDSAGGEHGGFGMPGHGLTSKTDIEVGPGESVVVEAVFDPTAHGLAGVGLNQRSIYLETNSQKSPKLELSFQAMVAR